MRQNRFIIIISAIIFVSLLMTSCKKEKNVLVTSELSGDAGELPIAEIWEIRDPYVFACEMGYYLTVKCDYGDSMDKLTDEERIIYIVYTLEGEVNNGGFSQYFFNSSGDNGNELVSAFEAIGAEKMTEICKKAVSVFGSNYPTDRNKRQEIMLDDASSDFGEVWAECDNEFFEYPEDTSELQYKYIVANKSYFS